MEHLEHPSAQEWEGRRIWFERVEEKVRGEGSYLLSEQACALCAEVQSVFCGGAWVAVIVLSTAVVEAQLRADVLGAAGGLAKLIDAAEPNEKLHQLRRRRNALVHAAPDAVAVTVDQQWGSREQLEREAQDAVRLMFEVLYRCPGV